MLLLTSTRPNGTLAFELLTLVSFCTELSLEAFNNLCLLLVRTIFFFCVGKNCLYGCSYKSASSIPLESVKLFISM